MTLHNGDNKIMITSEISSHIVHILHGKNIKCTQNSDCIFCKISASYDEAGTNYNEQYHDLAIKSRLQSTLYKNKLIYVCKAKKENEEEDTLILSGNRVYDFFTNENLYKANKKELIITTTEKVFMQCHENEKRFFSIESLKFSSKKNNSPKKVFFFPTYKFSELESSEKEFLFQKLEDSLIENTQAVIIGDSRGRN